MKFPLALKHRQHSKKDSGRASFRVVMGLALMGLLIFLVNVYSAPPVWWAERGVLDVLQSQNNYAAVNVGQLKNIAVKAMDEMDAKLPGGAGPAIHAMVQDWRDNKATQNQFTAAAVGQLKSVSKLYYDRLVEVGARPANAGYPWSNVPVAENYATANAGQLKNVFNFAIPQQNLDSPTGVVASFNNNTRFIDLQWADVDNETGYRIRRSLDGYSGWVDLFTTGPNVTSYRDESFASVSNPPANVYYRIDALSGSYSVASNVIQVGLGIQGYAADGDSDGDGVSNLQEYLDGTNASSALSKMEPVVWKDFVNTTVVGTNTGGLKKSSGAASTYDADAVSTKNILADGRVSFKTAAGSSLLVGLSAVNIDRNYTDLDFSMYPYSGAIYIYEGSTTSVATITMAYTANTLYTIERVSGAVKYYVDGLLVYTSAKKSTGPVMVDAAFYTVNSTISECRISTGDVDEDGMLDTWELAQVPTGAGLTELLAYIPTGDKDGDGVTNLQEYLDGTNANDALSRMEPVVWQSFVNTAIVGTNAGGLKKSAGAANTYDADAVSTKKILADGRVSFKATVGSHLLVGLNEWNANRGYADLDFTMQAASTGLVYIYEGGTNIPISTQYYNANTVFSIERIGDTVKYYMDGVVIYTSAKKSTGPVMIDTAFSTVNSTISECRIDTGAADSDGMPDKWELALLPAGSGYNEVLAFLPTNDLDSDGITNQQEYVDGTNASNALSKMEPVVWQNLVNTTIVGTNTGGLKKSAGAASVYDADAVSTKKILADGRVSFKATAGSYFLVGLNAVNSSRDYTDLEFSILAHSSGVIYIYEGSTQVATLSQTYTANTLFTIERVGGTVKYYVDGVLVYTSAKKSTEPVMIDTAFATVNSTISECRISTGDVDADGMPDTWELAQLPAGSGMTELLAYLPTGDKDGDLVTNLQEYQDGTNANDRLSKMEYVVWSGFRSTTAQGVNGGLKKTSGAADWNGDAIATKKILRDGSVAFVSGQTTQNVMIGLNAVNDNSNYPELDYVIHSTTTGCYVFEKGVNTLNMGAYTATTVFKVERVGDTVRYYKDGILMYTSLTKTADPLLVDSSFYQINDSISQCRIDTGDSDSDGMPDKWELALLPAGSGYNEVLAFLPTNDLDSDGITNQQEYVDGTNASNALSKMEPVVWKDFVNTAIVGTNVGGLKKSTGAANTYDADAVSTKKILADGRVSFKTATGSSLLVGLSAVNIDRNYTDLDFSMYPSAGAIYIYEGSTASVATINQAFTANTLYTIERVSGVVKYYVDGLLVYTSAKKSTGPVMVDAAFYTVNSTITECRYNTGDTDADGMPDSWELAQLPAGAGLTELQGYLPTGDKDGDLVTNLQEYQDGTNANDRLSKMEYVVWSAFRLTIAQGTNGGLKKTSGTDNTWNADAIATKNILGDGAITYVPGQTTKDVMIGLNAVNDSVSNTDLDYCIYANTVSSYVYEAGASKLDMGAYTATTVFKVARVGDTVKYYKDGVLMYTSLTKTTNPLLVDSSFYQLNAAISECRYDTGDTDGDGIPDKWELAQSGATTSQELPPNSGGYYQDTDGDGMPDAWESAHGLNPLSNADANTPQDTDSDGLPDPWEFRLGYGLVYQADNPDSDRDGTNDGNEDFDGDGLTNRDEIFIYNTRPDFADSDGDGMQNAWETAHGLNAYDASDALLDGDNDGLNNLGEFFFNTLPDDDDSDNDGTKDNVEFAAQYNSVVTGLTSVTANRTSSSVALSWVETFPYESSFLIQKSSNGGTTWMDVGSAPANSTAYTAGGLEQNTIYQFRVVTLSPYGSSTSSVVSEQTLPAKPAPPAALAVVSATATSVVLSWQDLATLETSYVVEGRALPAGAWGTVATVGANITTASPASLTGSLAYEFRVKAVNTGVASDLSNVVTLPALPAVVTGFTVQVPTWSQAQLQWTLPTDTTRTGIRMRGYVTGNPVPRVTADINATATNYIDGGLLRSTNYSYQVATINQRGETLSTLVAVTTPNGIPAAATGVQALPLGTRVMRVTWTDNAYNEASYVVERSTSPSGPIWVASAVLPANTTTYEDRNGLQGGTTYYYRVVGTNEFGQTTSAQGSGATSAYPQANRAPDALGVLADEFAPYVTNVADYAPLKTLPAGNVFTDVVQEGEFLTTSSGLLWFYRYTPAAPQGAAALNEVDIYLYTGGNWVYQSTFIPPVAAGTTSGYGTSIVASGNKVYISAPGALNGSSVATGQVYVYEFTGPDLSYTSTVITPADGAAGDQFGASMAVDGPRLIIGAPNKDKPGGTPIVDAGAVYLYNLSGSTWTLARTEWSQAAQTSGKFGFSVSLRGRNFVVGAPYEDGLFQVGSNFYFLNDTGSIYLGRWDQVGQYLGFQNLFVLYPDVQSNVAALTNSHFGYSVAIDSQMRLVIGKPDWTGSNALYDRGNVMMMQWNGELDGDYIFKINSFTNTALPAGSRFGEYVEETQDFDFGLRTGIRNTSNQPAQYFTYCATEVNPGQMVNSVDVPRRAGEMAALDEDQDPLTFTIPTMSNPYGAYFEIAPGGVLKAKSGLVGVANGLYTLNLSVSDDRGGTLTKTVIIDVVGAGQITDTDSDGMSDSWEFVHGLNLNDASDALLDPDGDGYTSLEEYQRMLSGQSSGVNPNTWDIPPAGDIDGDGVRNDQDADPTNPNVLILEIKITSPANSQTL